MSEMMFLASGLSAVDMAKVDAAIVRVLHAISPRLTWEVLPTAALTMPIVSASVDVVGLTNESLRVRMSGVDAARFAALLVEADEDTPAIAPEEFASELANTVAGHLKNFLADGMATGIPAVEDPDPGPLPGYRRMFRANSITVEVSSRG